MLHFLLDNVFIQVGILVRRKVFQQCVGILMGASCALLSDELLLHEYESNAMIRFSRTNGHPHAKSFKFTRRYIDDLISVNNPRFDKAIEKIYPSELPLKPHQPKARSLTWTAKLNFGIGNWSCLYLTKKTISHSQSTTTYISIVTFRACQRMEFTLANSFVLPRPATCILIFKPVTSP